ncbi:hypothetical protein BN946_scf184612.g2 [Trametes cinnabarina]|uniref:Transposase family Tnp2 protein n=1 Tax=Pycnoporus cinnabarinus TaxID=5643 RepID=A0A060SU36_PYCCI|nr:hypothetical protein BN946_scf184612.g2 [Trametes cinnabarina]
MHARYRQDDLARAMGVAFNIPGRALIAPSSGLSESEPPENGCAWRDVSTHEYEEEPVYPEPDEGDRVQQTSPPPHDTEASQGAVPLTPPIAQDLDAQRENAPLPFEGQATLNLGHGEVPGPCEEAEDPEYGRHEDNGAPAAAQLQELRDQQKFIELLKDATLEKSKLDAETIARLRDPPRSLPDLARDPDYCYALRLYMENGHSEKAYRGNRFAAMERDPTLEVPTYEAIERLVADLTGVTPIKTDMCVNSCCAFTGPYKSFENCPFCPEAEPRYRVEGKKRIARRTFDTLPFGPQAQTLYLSRQNATYMKRRKQLTAELITRLQLGIAMEDIEDFYCSSDYLDAVDSGLISDDDFTLMFSDGAQLYESKQSDCWVYIWVVFELGPDKRYKKCNVFPGAVIPGPQKPKNLESFLFPGLYHIAALQREGLKIWDAAEERLFTSFPIIIFATADSPAMAYLNGLVGHHGAQGCRLYCALRGRRKPHGAHYYPAMLKPLNYFERGCDHGDVTFADILGTPPGVSWSEFTAERYEKNLRYVLTSENQTQFARRRLETGIAKPSIFSGLPRNFGSFGRPPRNPALKINSGYKAWEFKYYVFGLLPGLLWALQLPLYHSHFCKLVAGIRVALLLVIPMKYRQRAHNLLLEFVQEFEEMYYQRRVDRLHFVRQSVHSLIHLIPEGLRVGPASLHSQWTLETLIGNLTAEIGSDIHPYANLSSRATQRVQVNALKAMFPEFADSPNTLPAGALDLDSGYVLMHARDQRCRYLDGPDSAALTTFLEGKGVEVGAWRPLIWKWARVRLPNGQIACTAWKECAGEKRGNAVRRSRMVKLKDNRFAEVLYLFPLTVKETNTTFYLAMVSIFSPPDSAICKEAHNILLACRYQGQRSREVVNIKDIQSVIAMVPLPLRKDEAEDPHAEELYSNRFFVVEKLGLDMVWFGREEMMDQDDDEGGEGDD